jgi:hypothetical protein
MKDFVRSRCQRIAASRYYTEEGVKQGILIPRHVRSFDSLGRQNVNDSVLSHFPSLLEIERTVERTKKDAENELNIQGLFKNQEILFFLLKSNFILFCYNRGVRASGPNRFVMAKNTATRSAAKTSSLSPTTSISENCAEDDELLDEETEDCDSYMTIRF